jgi:hypothetical protein
MAAYIRREGISAGSRTWISSTLPQPPSKIKINFIKTCFLEQADEYLRKREKTTTFKCGIVPSKILKHSHRRTFHHEGNTEEDKVYVK